MCTHTHTHAHTYTHKHTHTLIIAAFETPDVVQSAMGLSGMELGNAAVSVGPALRAPRAAAGAAGAAERGLKRAADADASEEASADKRARED